MNEVANAAMLQAAAGGFPNNNNNPRQQQQQQQQRPQQAAAATVRWTSHTAWKMSRWYCWISAVGAVMAILTAPSGSGGVTPPAPPLPSAAASSGTTAAAPAASSSGSSSASTFFLKSEAAAPDSTSKTATAVVVEPNAGDTSLSASSQVGTFSLWDSFFGRISDGGTRNEATNKQETPPAAAAAPEKKKKNNHPEEDVVKPPLPGWLRFLLQQHDQLSQESQQKEELTATKQAPLKKEEEEGQNQHLNKVLDFLSFIFHHKHHQEDQKRRQDDLAAASSTDEEETTWTWLWRVGIQSWMDPNLLKRGPHHHSTTAVVWTTIIDKILTSTVRLLLIANWLVALTVLLHTAVADWFLGGGGGVGSSRHHRHGGLGGGGEDEEDATVDRHAAQRRAVAAAAAAAPPPLVMDPNWANATATGTTATSSNATSSRERMGGFLLFKFLLISAVVAPDTLDLLILLSWFTVLTFLRSLAALCAQQTELAQASGQMPAKGVLPLLTTVLCLDGLAITVCVGLFHAAGIGMVLLLTCDCALLAVDVLTVILQHAMLKLEISHTLAISKLEDEQLELHQRPSVTTASTTVSSSPRRRRGGEEEDGDDDDEDDEMIENNAAPPLRQQRDDWSRELDHRMELLEQQHMRRTSFLESAVFGLQFFTDLLTIAHFFHIWTLHGLNFTLIDGVLALHLHSALSSASQKIAERRHMQRIAREMDDVFEDASELDLRKAAANGDVCCICYGTMSYFPTSSSLSDTSNVRVNASSGSHGTVKKVACGHLYHTVCLRKVVERARSMEATKCAMCRAYVVSERYHEGGRHHHGPDLDAARARATTNTENNTAANETGNNANNENRGVARNNDEAAAAPPVEDALFQFSTDGIFPAWLPLPSLSFAVVRRPATAAPPNAGDENPNNNNNNGEINHNARGDQQQQQQSFFRRMLLLAGAPMSPEEERAALEQLVDMFPQYDRQDLVRSLRQRGSSEAVAESIILGTFIGVPRGDTR